MSTIHVVYGGRNETLQFNDVFREDWLDRLGISQNPVPTNLSHSQIKQALANFYDINVNEFEAHFVEINPNGNITVRPNAKWGTTTEEDVRKTILNSFMTCPHRDTGDLKKIHEEMRQKDPVFYSHLAAWYKKNGELRDHNEVFTAMLLTDPYLENREVGLALFQQHAVFMKVKILTFLKGKKITLRTKTGKKIKGKSGKLIDEIKNTEKKVGLEKTIPSSFKTEIIRYLRWLEADNERFDAVALRNFNDLKTLYAAKGLQIKPSQRAKEILFENKIPEDSKLTILKRISQAKSPEEAAHLIVENKIAYVTAIGLISKITPSILIALINNMTPQEIITNMASLEEKGVMDNPGTKQLVMDKLKTAKKAKNVSTLKSKTAQKTGRIKNEEVIAQLDEIADEQVKKSGVIKIPTGILVDRSGSMNDAITVGKQTAAMVSGATTADLHVVAFDTMAQAIKAENKTMTAWEKAFAPIRSGGGTSIGCALEFFLRYNLYVEQFIIITDEDERNSPRFVDVFPAYVQKMKVVPHIIIIRIGSLNRLALSTDLKAASIEYDVYEPKSTDYYSLPGLIPLLSRKSKLDLVYEIMDFPLPQRKKYV